ncbi:unnamed protein product [Peniophora sp. CBMAI 1063]|nr:unnamed protein product [Peniophora sp. CBMAI 1063]
MDAFEDDNPFAQDTTAQSSNSSEDHVTVSIPSSPNAPASASREQSYLSPTSPTRPPFPSPGTGGFPRQSGKDDYCCYRDQWLHGDDAEVLIVDAVKTSEHASSPYIAYVIKSGNATARHRYSEFESLRNGLTRLYPTLIIPPIPSKQSIGEYAIKQGKAKEDANMIARRRRMLQTFLNRISRHPILSNEHVFHRFLDGEVSWSEIMNSPPLSLLPKNLLKAPAHNPTDPQASPAYQALPNPSALHPLRRPDQRFMDSEVFTNKFAAHLGGPMEKVTRRTMKRWSEFAQDHMDLGAAWNGFSLNETGQLATAIEKSGQAIDATYMSTARLMQDLEQNWQEPLHEYAQFASIIKRLLAYRHQKHVQLEMTQDALEARKEQLTELEKSEQEARRLEEALGRGRVAGGYGGGGAAVGSPTNGGRTSSAAAEGAEEGEGTGTKPGPEDEDPEDADPASSYLPPHPGPSPPTSRRRVPGMGLLNALSYTLHGMMDADPETARRAGIGKTRENIGQLEDALHLAAQDLKYASSTIQADLDRFQRQKVADLRRMGIEMAKSHRDWCKKNLEAWEDARREIALIPDHPNRAPPPAEPLAGPSTSTDANGAGPSTRRDSTATATGR